MSKFPATFRVRQRFDRPRVDDISAAVHDSLAKLSLGGRIRTGQRVAITAGSRGIANIAEILRSVADHVRSLEAEPFLVPAMGSHGGATAEGQAAMLETLGITEDACGCPIRSSMETIDLGQASAGFPIYADRLASEADHVIIVGRVKLHTIFSGDYQSGLMKMLLIGLGKHDGAKIYHRATQQIDFDDLVVDVAPRIIERCHVAAGLALLENAFDQTAAIEAIAPDDIMAREPQLLRQAIEWFPKLPFAKVDLLLIDQMGKNLSGSGMDTNVIGRKTGPGGGICDPLSRVKRIAVRRLTAQSHGNALGIGLADFCLASLVRDVDFQATTTNGLTSGEPEKMKIPIQFDTDREILQAALDTIGLTSPAESRLLWICDTLHLTELECSEAYWDEVQQRDDLEVVSDLRPLPIDADGHLPELKC